MATGSNDAQARKNILGLSIKPFSKKSKSSLIHK
jgi:hypothetical protein